MDIIYSYLGILDNIEEIPKKDIFVSAKNACN